MSLRGTDVAAMMTRVETTLAEAERSADGVRGVLPVAPEGDAEVNVAVLRKSADIRLDFPPGSARALVGPVVRLGKRTLRRVVRWYVTPMMEQQSRFNHALLDSIERLRVRIERQGSEPGTATAAAAVLPLSAAGRPVAVGRGAVALAELLTGDAGTRPAVLAGNPADELAALPAASVDLAACDVSGLGAESVVALLEGAHAALVPGALIVLSAAEAGGSLRPASLAWALSATGFVDVAIPTLPAPVAGHGDLATRLATVDAVAQAANALVMARRGG